MPPVVVLDACVLYPAAQERMRDNLRNPPKTTQECLDTLFVQGLKEFSALMQAVG